MSIKVNSGATLVTGVTDNLAQDVVSFVKVNAAETIVFANTQVESGSASITQSHTVVASGTNVEARSGSASISQGSSVAGAGSKTSDPLTLEFEFNDWGRAYYGNEGQSGKIPGTQPADGEKAFRFGWGYNNEDEASMLGLSASDITALEAMIDERPNISKITMKYNIQHTQNGLDRTCYFGWHGESSEPALFQRLHTETHADWSSGAINIPTNSDNDGDEAQFDFPAAVLTKMETEMAAGNIAGVTASWSAASSSTQWGWMSGTHYCTDEVSGGCGGSWISTASHAKAPRIEVTADY